LVVYTNVYDDRCILNLLQFVSDYPCTWAAMYSRHRACCCCWWWWRCT